MERRIRTYKDRLRIFLILYIFSDNYTNLNKPNLKKIFTSEVRIQKLDFLLRNPDYLSYSLLTIVNNNSKDDIKKHIMDIYKNEEPVYKKLEMERFFFGAYEDIDDVISFLKSIGFIVYQSKKNTQLQNIEKKYYITDYAINKIGDKLNETEYIKWYVDRCYLIKEYFGSYSGSKLKGMQYKISNYKNTPLNHYISDIQELVRKKFFEVYGEQL